MEALTIIEGEPPLNWEYDEEAGALYISGGKPRPALGLGRCHCFPSQLTSCVDETAKSSPTCAPDVRVGCEAAVGSVSWK